MTIQLSKLVCGAAAAATLAVGATPAFAARDQVWSAGSSTVFPFSTRVAEQFARKSGGKPPKVESLGTGGGMKLFCGGSSDAFPDIANASRRMTAAEFDSCQAKGVKDIIEIKIGYDGIVVATDKKGSNYNFNTEHLFLGLSGTVMRHGEWVKNPYKTWNEVGAALPAKRIQVYGPPPTSGTRDAFVELALEEGARKIPDIAEQRSKDEKLFKQRVDPVRTDGGWIDAGENDNAIVATLTKTPDALGVFGYSFLEENLDKVKGARVNGIAPTAATISDGSYPLSRSLFIYVKKSSLGVVPGLKGFVDEFLSDAATSRGGYLQDRGLIPLPAKMHAGAKAAVAAGTTMTRP